MIFLGKNIPIELLKDRTRDVSGPLRPIGKCKILSYSKNTVRMKVIKSSREEHLNKILYISKHTFFMSLAEEDINNIGVKLPPVSLSKQPTLYEK